MQHNNVRICKLASCTQALFYHCQNFSSSLNNTIMLFYKYLRVCLFAMKVKLLEIIISDNKIPKNMISDGLLSCF